MPMTFNEAYIPGLGKSAGVRAQVVDAAEHVAASARASAPVDSGEYQAEIRVEVSETEYRVVATVVAGAKHSMLVESRTGNLSRALQRSARG